MMKIEVVYFGTQQAGLASQKQLSCSVGDSRSARKRRATMVAGTQYQLIKKS